MKKIIGFAILIIITLSLIDKSVWIFLGILALFGAIIYIIVSSKKDEKPTNSQNDDTNYQNLLKPRGLREFDERQRVRTNDARIKVLELQKLLDADFEPATNDKTAKFIFIDFETTCLPPDYTMPNDTILDRYPSAVQVACLVFNKSSQLIDRYYSILNPGKVYFSTEATKIHGITKQIAKTQGKPVIEFLIFFKDFINIESVVIAHNVQFDNLILKIEAKRNQLKLGKYKTFCTMKSTKEEVGIFKNYGRGYKYPKLKELVEHTFTNGCSIGGLNFHDAYSDVQLCALCFFKKNMNKDFI